ncbi:MAG: twin-arginine translocase TatA/TatE family subunit [Caldilineae bacterium]|nr:MAG: twin-arginine translocase TatA/TatE family subunit [Caldilineae bacterium]
MPNLGVPELIVLLVIVLAIFGAGKLPQVGRAVGQSLREFREAVSDEDTDRQPSTSKASEQ